MIIFWIKMSSDDRVFKCYNCHKCEKVIYCKYRDEYRAGYGVSETGLLIGTFLENFVLKNVKLIIILGIKIL